VAGCEFAGHPCSFCHAVEGDERDGVAHQLALVKRIHSKLDEVA
jgi:hypothetical protein